MITLSTAAADIITSRSYRRYLRVESWLGDELLADDVPVAAASEEGDATLRVPERLTLTVPRRDRGTGWSPTEVDHPLAAEGQRLRVDLGIEVAGDIEWFQRGEYVITDAKPEGDTVTVNAAGLLYLVNEARLVSPYQPTGTFVSTLRGLTEPAVTVTIDSALTDRAVPTGLTFDENRLDAVNQLLDAWPAKALMQPEGYLLVTADTAPTVALRELTSGTGGTAYRPTGNSDRADAYNAVVARGTTSAGVEIQAVAYDYYSSRRVNGDFNPLPQPYYFESPLLTTIGQCQSAAGTILRRLLREGTRGFEVDTVPDPRIQLGDATSITDPDAASIDGVLCTLEAYSLPYIGSDAAMGNRLKAVL